MAETRVWARLFLTSALAGGLLLTVSTARADHDWRLLMLLGAAAAVTVGGILAVENPPGL